MIFVIIIIFCAINSLKLCYKRTLFQGTFLNRGKFKIKVVEVDIPNGWPSSNDLPLQAWTESRIQTRRGKYKDDIDSRQRAKRYLSENHT